MNATMFEPIGLFIIKDRITDIKRYKISVRKGVYRGYIIYSYTDRISYKNRVFTFDIS